MKRLVISIIISNPLIDVILYKRQQLLQNEDRVLEAQIEHYRYC